MPGIKYRLAAAEVTLMLTDELPITNNYDPVSIHPHLNRLSHMITVNAVAIAIIGHQTAGTHPRRPLRIAVKARGQFDKIGFFLLKNLPDAFLWYRWMALGLGPTNTALHQISIELGKVFDLQPRGKKSTPYQANLIFHLTLFPSGRRCAGDGLKQIM